jgi:hypothetical protein
MSQRKDSGIRPDTQRQRKNRNDSKSWSMSYLTPCKADILDHLIKEWQPSLQAIALFDLSYASKFEQSRSLRVLWRHSPPQVLVSRQVNVLEQFLVKLFIELLRTQECNAATPPDSQPVHIQIP